MDALIFDLVARGSYFGIFLLMVLENVIPPIPSELIMGMGGVLVHRGEMAFWPLLLIGTAGTVLGNYFWYWLGAHWGGHRLEPFIDRWGKWLTVEWRDIARAQAFFYRHGHWVVFFTRFTPFLRTLISLPAGLSRMPLMRFVVFTFAGSLVWNALLITGGQWLGHYLQDSQDVLGWVILGVVALTIASYIWRLFTWTPQRQPGAD